MELAGKKEMRQDRQTGQKTGRIVALAAVLMVALGLMGCGKTVVYKGGIDYPYEIKEKPGGTLQISLNGSKTPDYLWEHNVRTLSFEQMDIDGNPVDPLVVEPPVLLKQKGSGKEGKGKYVIKPALASDGYQMVFTLRRKDTTEPEIVYNAAGLEEETGYDDYSARLYVTISVNPDAKGKLHCHVEDIDLSELTGAVYMAQDTPYGYSYMIAEDGSLIVELPALNDYEMSMEEGDLPEEIRKAQTERIEKEEAIAKDNPAVQTEENAAGTGEQDASQPEASQPMIHIDFPDDYSDYDEETAEELRKLDEELAAYYQEHAEEIQQTVLKNIYESIGMVDDETAKTEGRNWDQNPNLPIWKTGDRLSADRSIRRFVFESVAQGSVTLTAKSELAGLTISFVIDADENGRISVRRSDYEGGQTMNEKAFVSYTYEHGEDETPDDGSAEGENAEEDSTTKTEAEESTPEAGDDNTPKVSADSAPEEGAKESATEAGAAEAGSEENSAVESTAEENE